MKVIFVLAFITNVLKGSTTLAARRCIGSSQPMTSVGFVVMSALTATTQVVATQSNVLFLTQAHGVANLSISLSLRVTITQSMVGVPNIMGT